MVDRKRIFSGLVLGVFLAASAVPSLAGGYMHGSKGDEKAAGHEKPMKHPMGSTSSEFETMEFGDAGVPAESWGPVEAGTLPGTEERGGLQDTGVDPSRWDEPQAE